MKIKFSLVFLICTFYLNNWAQQNLVPNYSFEDYTICPTATFGEINKAYPWFQPNYPYGGAGGSSDFDHFCAGYDCNSFKQCPRTGSGMAGISFFTYPSLYDTDYWREYLEVQLIDSLTLNKKYCIKFYVNFADLSCYPVKQIQCKLTNDSLLYNSPNYEFIPGIIPTLESQVMNSDSINWTLIQGEYLSTGNENFITIGNFSPGDSVDYIDICGSIGPSSLPGYYFIDDVSIYELPDYNAGIDTTICPWDSIIIGPQNVRGDVQYSWSPVEGLSNSNIANPLASPLVNTNYILTITDTCQWACNSILTDTIFITVGGCLGVAEIENKIKSRLVPNPASTFCVYEAELETNQSGKIEIFDINGKLIESFSLKEGENRLEIALTSYQNGVYIFKIIVDEELIETKRLVITK